MQGTDFQKIDAISHFFSVILRPHLTKKHAIGLMKKLCLCNALFKVISNKGRRSIIRGGCAFPTHFSYMDSHQAGRRGFRNGSPFGSGFPIGASSSPVGTRLCLQSLVCYTFAGQLLPSKSFVPSLTHKHDCMYQKS